MNPDVAPVIPFGSSTRLYLHRSSNYGLAPAMFILMR